MPLSYINFEDLERIIKECKLKIKLKFKNVYKLNEITGEYFDLKGNYLGRFFRQDGVIYVMPKENLKSNL